MIDIAILPTTTLAEDFGDRALCEDDKYEKLLQLIRTDISSARSMLSRLINTVPENAKLEVASVLTTLFSDEAPAPQARWLISNLQTALSPQDRIDFSEYATTKFIKTFKNHAPQARCLATDLCKLLPHEERAAFSRKIIDSFIQAYPNEKSQADWLKKDLAEELQTSVGVSKPKTLSAI